MPKPGNFHVSHLFPRRHLCFCQNVTISNVTFYNDRLIIVDGQLHRSLKVVLKAHIKKESHTKGHINKCLLFIDLCGKMPENKIPVSYRVQAGSRKRRYPGQKTETGTLRGRKFCFF